MGVNNRDAPGVDQMQATGRSTPTGYTCERQVLTRVRRSLDYLSTPSPRLTRAFIPLV
jgi:hypothetical protein